jgi:hypothetical protein
MSHEISGSDKLKAKCQTLASLSAEEINQIAGGGVYGGSYPFWLIRGIPVDIYRVAFQPQVVEVGGFEAGGFTAGSFR